MRYAPEILADHKHSTIAMKESWPPAAMELPRTFPAFAASHDQLAIVQSALWDPRDSILRLFIDAHADAVIEIQSCRAGRKAEAQTSPATLMFLNDGHYSWPMRGYIVQCRWPMYKPDWAALAFNSLRELPLPVAVHEVETSRTGMLAACVGVAYSHQDSHEWLMYHSKLGVEWFHQYYVGGIHTDSKEPVQPFSEHHISSMSWQEIYPLGPDLRYLFSQITMYNECLYRLRHRFKYLVVIDTDEFIHLALPPHKIQQPALHAFLDDHMPEHVAAMLLLIWAYPKQCQPPSSSDSIVAQSTLREATAQMPGMYDYVSWINGRNKMIIRSQGVLELCVHRICTVADGWDKQVLVPQELAFIKHFRKWKWWDDKCDLLQQDPDRMLHRTIRR